MTWHVDVPAREARAVELRAGQSLIVVDVAGGQVADTWAFVREDLREHLSAEHTRVAVGALFPAVGEDFVTDRRRPVLRLAEDRSPGLHDLLVAACDPARYAQLGVAGWHASCEENLRRVMAVRGVGSLSVPSPVNLFMNTPFLPDGRVRWLPAQTAPGDAVVLTALLDCLVVVSACPQGRDGHQPLARSASARGRRRGAPVTEVPPRLTVHGRTGQVDASLVPRFAGPATFARLPRLDEVSDLDVAVVGVPFDAGVSYRPGARFGPAHVRESSRLLRPYNPVLDVSPFARLQVADAGDLAVNPFSIEEAIGQVERGADALLERAGRLLTIGGDHTIALPLLRALARRHGPLAVVHFDAHLDTWDTYFGAAYTHGTPFRRASEEGLLDLSACMHVGIRGPLYAATDLSDDRALGFSVVHAHELEDLGSRGVVERVLARVQDRPVYVSVDIDVLDPAFAPGTGTPESGGLLSRELLAVLRGLRATRLVGADLVEVAPAYDHAEITGIAAAHVAYELLSAMAVGPAAA